MSEVLVSNPIAPVPLVYISRTGWAEENALRDYLMGHEAGVNMPASEFHSGNWRPYIERAALLKTRSPAGVTGSAAAAVVVEMILTFVSS